jgi:heptosyltransferase-2
MARELRAEAFDTAVIPHRSLRSALICRLAGIPVRIGFDTSMGRFLLTHKERYVPADHEILRNLALSHPLGITRSGMRLPKLYPSGADRLEVDSFLREQWGEAALQRPPQMIAVAPGSVWNTKRWPEQKYGELLLLLLQDQWSVVLIGGQGDKELCARLREGIRDARVVDSSGRLSLLQSADLISRCAAIVTNDSAPMHLALAMRVPIVALFGPTAPEFGFAPVGRDDRVVETAGLRCRPCAIHGGKKCPIGTFDCMEMILPVRVRNEVHALSHRVS